MLSVMYDPPPQSYVANVCNEEHVFFVFSFGCMSSTQYKANTNASDMKMQCAQCSWQQRAGVAEPRVAKEKSRNVEKHLPAEAAMSQR